MRDGIREIPQELSVVEAVARAIHASPVFQPAHGPWREDVMAAGQQHCMKAARAAIAAYRGSSVPLVANLDAEVLAELEIQLRKPSGVILPVEREGWQPIETAPKNGKPVIGAFWSIRWADSHRKGDIVRCWYQPEFEAFISSCRQMTMAPGYTINGKTSELHSPVIEPVTHWMPLPPPPLGTGRNQADANSKSPIQAREE